MTATSAFDLEREADWEVAAVQAAAARYRAWLAHQDTVDHPGVQSVLSRVVQPYAAAIAASADAGLKGLTKRGGVGNKGSAIGTNLTLALLTPEVLAVTALAVAIRGATGAMDGSPGRDAPVLMVATGIAKAVHLQLEKARWDADTKSGVVSPDEALLKRFTTSNRNMRADAWRRWRARLGAIRSEKWTFQDEVALGATLVHLLVTAAPKTFRLHDTSSQGATTRRLGLTEGASSMIQDVTVRAEFGGGPRVPMLIPPIPWQLKET